jgi:hypothetical protein
MRYRRLPRPRLGPCAPAGIDWTVNVTAPDPDLEFDLGSSGSHKMYVTWAAPGYAPTLKRVDFVCDEADGSGSQGAVADALWAAVAASTQFGSGNTDGWALLDGGTGDCDNQAYCMALCVEMTGIDASVVCVYASLDAGEGNCVELEPPRDTDEYLILDFDTGTGFAWKAYEGCCVTAGSFYAITPYLKRGNDYLMLLAIPCDQWWVVTNGYAPGEPGWGVYYPVEEEPKP